MWIGVLLQAFGAIIVKKVSFRFELRKEVCLVWIVSKTACFIYKWFYYLVNTCLQPTFGIRVITFSTLWISKIPNLEGEVFNCQKSSRELIQKQSYIQQINPSVTKLST